MGGVGNHPQHEDFNAWMRGVERRMLTQERRSSQFQLQLALGPGAGKFSTQVFDWNNERTWFNGTYWSDLGSFNSPDGTRQWVVVSRVVAGVGGYQEAVSLDAEQLRQVRFFTFATREIPSFDPWFGDTVWADASLLNTFGVLGAPFYTPGYRIKSDHLELRGVATFPNGFDPYSLVIFNLPIALRPSAQSVHAVDSGVGHARVDVTSGGDVVCYTSTTTLVHISLDNLVVPLR